MKYRHKPTGDLVEIISFDELVAIGREQNPGRAEMPWSFTWEGAHVTHETDHCYLVGGIRVRRGDHLGCGIESKTKYLVLHGLDPESWVPVNGCPAPSCSRREIEATKEAARHMFQVVPVESTQEVEIKRLRKDLELAELSRKRWAETAALHEKSVRDVTGRLEAVTRDLDREFASNREFASKLEAVTRDRDQLREQAKAREVYINTQHVTGWERIQAALPETAADDSRSLVDRILERLACADYCERKLEVQAPAPDPHTQPVWCQVEGNLTSEDLDRRHVLLTCSSHFPQTALILCNRQPDGSFTPIARGFLPTYTTPG